MTWTPPKPEPCGPDCTCRTDAHPTGHAAQSIGDHDRRQREVDTELARLRPCRSSGYITCTGTTRAEGDTK